MSKLKQETAEFTTEKSLQQIVAVIRQFQAKYKAEMETIDSGGDALSAFDGPQDSDIQVVLSARLGMINGLRHFRMGAAQNIWAVQVYVDDMGTARHVTLIALGHGGWDNFVNCHGAMNLGASRERMQQLTEMLK